VVGIMVVVCGDVTAALEKGCGDTM